MSLPLRYPLNSNGCIVYQGLHAELLVLDDELDFLLDSDGIVGVIQVVVTHPDDQVLDIAAGHPEV